MFTIQDICARDVGLIVNAAKLDSLTGNNANFLSRRAGIRYYASASGLAANSITKKTETVAAITFVKNLVNLILQKPIATTYPKFIYTICKHRINNRLQQEVDIGAKFDIVTDIINDGNAFDAPAVPMVVYNSLKWVMVH